MSTLGLALAGRRGALAPGERIEGTASWRLEAAPQRVEVRLFWFTRGKGTQDVGVVGTVGFESPSAGDEGHFSFVAPQEPHSFSGRLVTLVWALELVVEPGGLAERVELVIAPGGREILLHPRGAAAAP